MSSLEMSTARAAAAAAAFCPFLEATSFTSGNTRHTHKEFMHLHHYKLCIELQDYTLSFIALVHGQRKEYLPHTVFRIVRIIYSIVLTSLRQLILLLLPLTMHRPVGSKFEMVRPYYSAKCVHNVLGHTHLPSPPHTTWYPCSQIAF